MAVGNNSAFNDAQMMIMQQIMTDGTLTDVQRQEAYAALVSDNYSKEVNLTDTYSDGVTVDVSEMTVLEKTKLDGEFVACDDNFEKGAKAGDTKEVCGGTLTYKGKEKGFFGFSRVNTGDSVNIFGIEIDNPMLILPGMDKGQIVHYEGVLGSFDYNTRDFELSYYRTVQNGNEINVPVLRYRGDDGYRSVTDGTEHGVTDGKYITIPEGLEIADYMFAGTSIETMPDISACSTLKSAHCMFKDCKNMTYACESALDADGNLKYPSNLEDISWIFAGSGMTQFFGEIGEKAMDARCAARDCDSLGYVPVGDAKDQGTFRFVMPNLTKARYLVDTYCDDMFDNSNTEVEKVVSSYVQSNPENPGHISEWTDEKGAHNNIFDKVNDGSYDAERIQKIMNEASKREVLKLIDPLGKGMTGVASDTNDFMSSAVQLTDGGALQDSSTWAMLRQTDKTFTSEQENQMGAIIDHAAAFLGTYGVLNLVTRNKWIGLIGAAVPQLTGVACKVTPILDTVSAWLGEDNKVGGFLSKMSGLLKKQELSYHTDATAIDVETVFAEQQDASVRFARNQVGSLLQRNSEMLYDESGYVLGAEYDASAVMYANGQNLASDGNLITIALTPEATLSNSLNTTLMATACDGIAANFMSDVEKNGGIASDSIKQEYSGYFMTLLSNISSYSDGALEKLDDKYVTNMTDKEKALCGLGKVMRNTAEPLYSVMHELDSAYGIFDDTDRKFLDDCSVYGMPGFTGYTPDASLVPSDSDRYVSELEADKDILKNALDKAVSSEEIHDAYNAYYKSSYGYLMDEAKGHNVVLADVQNEGTDRYAKACEDLGVHDSVTSDDVAGVAMDADF